MTSTFWGLRLEPGKRYSTTVDKAFHVTMAALDCNTVKNEKDIHCVMLEEGESNIPFILCNLQKPKVLQSRLDLNFESGDRITFFCRGTGTIHLTGYILPEEDYSHLTEEGDDEEVEEEEEEDEDEDEEEDEEEEEGKDVSDKGSKINGVPGKRKGEGVAALPVKKKKKQVVEQQESGDESDEEDEVDDEEEEMEADDESADSEVEDESDEESESEIPVEDKKPSPNLEKQGKKKNKKQGLQQPASQQQQQGKQKQNAQLNGAQQGAQQKKKPQQQQPGGEKTGPGKRTLEGGVTVQDLKVGNGPICKPGKVVTVYYTGRLKSNNKVFDQTSQGPGLKFRIGRGEVIKGWDVGLSGMKVGGKRLINIPSSMAYGQKGMAPTIPPNSALVFEVELKGVS